MKIPLALVGCGKVAGKHLAALRALSEEIEVVGLVDPDEKARARADRLIPAPQFAGLDELLAAPRRPQVVSLATPTGLHPRQALQCAEAGIDVLTEKPLGTSLQEASEMVRRFQALKRRLYVVKQLRFHPLFLALREAVMEERFGEIYTLALQVFWCRPQSYYDEARWRGTREMDGGALLNQASHYIDLLGWIFGPVEDVQAQGGAMGRKIESEDTALVSLRFEEGFMGSLHVSMLARERNLATSLTVLGSKGMVRLDGPACDQVLAWEFDDPTALDEEIALRGAAVPEALRRGHEQVYREMVTSLRGHGGAVVHGEEALRSLAIIDAAYRAMAASPGRRLAPLEVR